MTTERQRAAWRRRKRRQRERQKARRLVAEATAEVEQEPLTVYVDTDVLHRFLGRYLDNWPEQRPDNEKMGWAASLLIRDVIGSGEDSDSSSLHQGQVDSGEAPGRTRHGERRRRAEQWVSPTERRNA